MAEIRDHTSPLVGPVVNDEFAKALEELVAAAKRGQSLDSQFYNPDDQWLVVRMRIFQDLPEEQRAQVLKEAERIELDAERANAEGKAAARTWPDVVFRLDTGGLAFFSQLGVARRPDITRYFVDGYPKNRDALAFDEANQALFADVLPYITRSMRDHFASGDTIVQSDRRICDAPGRSFHARQLLFGTRYPQIATMWRQLTFDLADHGSPDILEVTIPNWLEDVGMPDDLKDRVRAAGFSELVLKAPTQGLSLHLGFDYVGEHKMGPLTIAMFMTREEGGLAVQAALSVARAKTLNGDMRNTALVTVGPSLHGKSTLTIMIELAGSDLAGLLHLEEDTQEGVCPMNDDIVLIRPLADPVEVSRHGKRVRISHGIDGTENNFYAVPFGLTREDDSITYDAARGTEEAPNSQETLENVPVNAEDDTPDYLRNPVRNMRMILSRPRLIARKRAERLLEEITKGRTRYAAYVPMEQMDAVFWQAVMRQNTVVPPLRRVGLEQYVRVLMYGEAVQMGAATGAIGKPYVEYFSDPFIIGLEDENANRMYEILTEMAEGGLPQSYYVFNTGGVGADTNEEASGTRYRKIPRELTLMLQEALLREAVAFERDDSLGSDVAVAIVDRQGKELMDLRTEWLPRHIYGQAEYDRRVVELRRRRYYGRDEQDKAGILRYTKVTEGLLELDDVPSPRNERELAWLLSFCWHVDEAYASLEALGERLGEGRRPSRQLLLALRQKYEVSLREGLELGEGNRGALARVGLEEAG